MSVRAKKLHLGTIAERKQPMEPTSNCASGAQLGSCLSQAEPERPMPNRRRETEAKARPRDQAAAEKWKSSRPRQKQARAKPGTRQVQPRTSKPRTRHRDSSVQKVLFKQVKVDRKEGSLEESADRRQAPSTQGRKEQRAGSPLCVLEPMHVLLVLFPHAIA